MTRLVETTSKAGGRAKKACQQVGKRERRRGARRSPYRLGRPATAGPERVVAVGDALCLGRFAVLGWVARGPPPPPGASPLPHPGCAVRVVRAVGTPAPA